MHDDSDIAILDRYVADDCAPDERARVERWIAQQSERRTLVDELRQLHTAVRAIDASEPAWDTRAMWQELARKLPPATSAPASPRGAARFGSVMRRPGTRTSWQRNVLRAATIVVAAGAVLTWWRVSTPRTGGAPAAALQVVTSQVAETRAGQRTTVRLPDGTIASIAAQSTLDIADGYGESTRDVYLAGEGYFEVTHDPARPFRVHSGRSVTQVIGTKFGVQAYQDETTMTVVVAEGRVAFAPSGVLSVSGQLILGRGDRARQGADEIVRIERNVDVDRALAWTRGRLEFVDVPLDEAARSIGRWYDLDIEVDSALAHAPFTGAFGLESLDDVLQLLALALDAQLDRDGRHVVVRPRR